MFKKLSFFVCFIFVTTSVYSQLPQYYSSELIQNNYNVLMGTIFNSDGTKMFAWTQNGQIFLSNWDDNQYVKQNTAVLDISDEVSGYRDFGLISICLDPDFDNNGFIYLFYSVDRHHLIYSGTAQYNPNTNDYYKASICRITRYTLNLQQNPMTTDYNSRLILLGESITTGIPLTHESHAGGSMVFGTDGTLLVTTGDNASYSTTDTGSVGHTYYQQALNDGIMRPEENVGAFRSQMINSLCGKILRLDPATGNGISSNPHYDSNNPRSAKSRMYAMGFRNPFRMVIKPNSGSTDPADANPGMLFVADVGWNTWEDLHVIDKPGLNAGWPLYEGQTILSSYYNSGTTNQDEGNVLFKIQCVQPTSFTDDANPANRRYTHSRPSVTWRHGSNQTRVPWFSGTTPTDPRIGSAGSPTTGIEFRGNTGVAGVFITGTGFGAALENKLLITDYIANWVNIASFNTTNSPWINNVSSFAPSNYGSGIVHMSQNPIDGSVYYSNIFTGEIKRFSFYDPTLTNDEFDINSISIYPNPAQSFITIEGVSEELNIEIYNVSGQLLKAESIQNATKIPFSFNSGLYFVKINLSNGKQFTKKLIVD